MLTSYIQRVFMKTKTTIMIILLIILASNLSAGGNKHFQSISKLSEFVKLDNYSSLYSELLNNRKNYKEESLLFYIISTSYDPTVTLMKMKS
jgi:hypothetical protein